MKEYSWSWIKTCIVGSLGGYDEIIGVMVPPSGLSGPPYCSACTDLYSDDLAVHHPNTDHCQATDCSTEAGIETVYIVGQMGPSTSSL